MYRRGSTGNQEQQIDLCLQVLGILPEMVAFGLRQNVLLIFNQMKVEDNQDKLFENKKEHIFILCIFVVFSQCLQYKVHQCSRWDPETGKSFATSKIVKYFLLNFLKFFLSIYLIKMGIDANYDFIFKLPFIRGCVLYFQAFVFCHLSKKTSVEN